MTHVWLHSLEPGFESHLSSIGDQLADRLGSSNHSVSKWIPFSSERTHRDEHQSILLLVGDWKNFSRSDYFVAANALALHESGVVLLLPVIIARPEITRKGDEVWLERYSALWQRLHKLAILTPQSDELNLNELVAKVSDAHLAHSNNARKTQTLPATLFFSYCHRDQGLRDELAHHLKLLERVIDRRLARPKDRGRRRMVRSHRRPSLHRRPNPPSPQLRLLCIRLLLGNRSSDRS